VFFQTDYDKIEFERINFEVILSRHHNYVNEKRHQNNGPTFSILDLSQSKFLATPVHYCTLFMI